jgi:hypothetical protein
MTAAVAAVLLRALPYPAALVLLWCGGNFFCRLTLAIAGAMPVADANSEVTLRAGRVIGMLERTMVFIGIAAGRWEMVAAVVALKSVGRYKELEKQINAEYFLVGSLASILWAVMLTLSMMYYDRRVGFGFLASD